MSLSMCLEDTDADSGAVGLMALPRSPLASEAIEEKEAEDVVDTAALPPS